MMVIDHLSGNREEYRKTYLTAHYIRRLKSMISRLKSIDFFTDAYKRRIAQLIESKEQGKKIIGTFCLYVPDEIIYAAGADRIVLCGGRNDSVQLAEEYLPRNVCPVIKSSFGSIIAESEVLSLRSQGFLKEDIAAGLVDSIAKGIATMAKQVGLNKNVAIVGGVAKNEGIRAAIEKELGVTLFIPTEPQITGALGAALYYRN